MGFFRKVVCTLGLITLLSFTPARFDAAAAPGGSDILPQPPRVESVVQREPLQQTQAAPAVNPRQEETANYDVPTLRAHLRAVDDLEARKVITPEIAQKQRQFYLDEAAQTLGRPIQRDELEDWSAFRALFTVRTVIMVLGGLLLVAGLVVLGGTVFWELITHLPPLVWELALYGLAGSLLFATAHPVAWLVGALLLPVALTLRGAQQLPDRLSDWSPFISGISCLVWGAAAVLHGSSVLGFLAVLALESFLGFSMFVGPLCIGLGFSDEHATARGTIASFPLMLAGIALSAWPLNAGGLGILSFAAPFQTGLVFAGTFIYFLGMLILSSKWVAKRQNYWLLQVLTIASGIAALFFGTALEIGLLKGIGGTFFVVYLLEKYAEISLFRAKTGWVLLGLGLVLLVLWQVMGAFPAYFLFHF